MTKYEVSITSDTVCPWCYIGFLRLQAAIAQHLTKHPHDNFAISWHPFQLNPHGPKGRSIEKARSNVNVLRAQPVEAVNERLRSAGKEVGITFKNNPRTGNTLDSHRLIEFARQKDDVNLSCNSERSGVVQSLQTRLVEELFGDYFERDQDIIDHHVLAKAANRVGIDEGEAKSFLATNTLAAEVEKEATSARSEGVNGVPHFVINDVFHVEGAQEPNAFLMLFERFKKKEGRRTAALL